MAFIKGINLNKFTSNSFMEKIFSYKIGIIPFPFYLVILAVIYMASVYNKLSADLIGGWAITMALGMFLQDLGGRIPGLKHIGGPAIVNVVVPSAIAYYSLFNASIMKSMTNLFQSQNFLLFFIALLVVGSIIGMNRVVLIKGLVRMFISLLIGTIASIVVGTLVGGALGLGYFNAFFYVVIPIISGGVGEGVLPLSMSYAVLLQRPYEQIIPELIPAAMIGNFVAVIIAGSLNRLGEKKPELTGNGMLAKLGSDDLKNIGRGPEGTVNFTAMASAFLLALTFYTFGGLVSVFVPFPTVIIMIILAALCKAINIVPSDFEQGCEWLHRFVVPTFVGAILVGVGALYMPMKDLIRIITLPYIVTCIVTVVAMAASGFFIAKYTGLYPIEAAIVTACHSGLGGSGDVAILGSCKRMVLMPFAQVSTRLGGACMVIIATLLMKFLL